MSAVCIKSAISRTICFSKCNRCASQKDCCLHCYCSRGVVWSSEHAASCFLSCGRSFFLFGCVVAFPFCEDKGSTHGVAEESFCSFSSSRPCNPSVPVMRSKALWVLPVVEQTGMFALKTAAVTYGGAQGGSRGCTNLNFCEPTFHL